MLASVVISTYNRAAALPATLDALGRQDVPPSEYEVLVVDDGSTDETWVLLGAVSPPYTLRTFRLPINRGVSAGRNVGLRNAEGRYVIMISDDLIVPSNFISTHVETLSRFPGSWIVGGFEQLDALGATAFGRYLDELERQFESARLNDPVDDDLFDMDMPTARNLSLPRADLERVGLFDEQFQVTCEDQDLAHRARQHGIRFIYNAKLQCIHNDQASTLSRYCSFQLRGARDTARLCEKYPEVHSQGTIARANAYVLRSDDWKLKARKMLKRLLVTPPFAVLVDATIGPLERLQGPKWLLRRCYTVLIGLYTFRGFRQGLREVGGRRSRLMQELRGIESG